MFSEEEVKEALEFLNIAKKDFEAAELLLDRKYYPQGLFLLQQSIEKATKSILRALGLADIETLRREIGHEILVKGLRRIGYEALSKFKDEFTRMFMKDLVRFCRLVSSCPDAYEHFDEMIKSIMRSAESIQEWLDKRYDKEIKNNVDRLGHAVFSESEEAERVIDKLLNVVSMYIVNPTEAVRKLGIETITAPYWRFERATRKCLKKLIKDRNELARSLAKLNKYSEQFLEPLVRIVYLLGTYLLLLAYHTLFENKASILRYPSKDWTPLSISDNSVIVKESKKIIDFVHKQELLSVLGDFIRGKVVHNRSKNIYTTLVEYIKALKSPTTS